MDPLAHTLLGATLAEAGLKKTTRYATAVLLIGVNLPDIDGVAQLWGSDISLLLRRGWTHGLLALLILPLLLTAVVWAWHRWRSRPRSDAPAFRPRRVLLLACLAVWSHPLLDWLNTYGVRLLMPFDDRWFYGDTLFIIDPWFWLLASAAVVLARSEGRSACAAWIVLGLVTSLLLVLTDAVPVVVQVIWFTALLLIIILRVLRLPQSLIQQLARAGFAGLVLYVCAAYGLARLAESLVLEGQAVPLEVQANPVPALPHQHRLVMKYPDHYRVVMPDGESFDVQREKADEVVLAAMADPSVRGFMDWVRYLYWDVEERGDHWRVQFRDLRYLNPGEAPRGIGAAVVIVPKTGP